MYHYTDEQNDKNHFVIYYLQDMLHYIDKSIHKVKYTATEDTETVTIGYDGGHELAVDVTADSLTALAKDVLRKI